MTQRTLASESRSCGEKGLLCVDGTEAEENVGKEVAPSAHRQGGTGAEMRVCNISRKQSDRLDEGSTWGGEVIEDQPRFLIAAGPGLSGHVLEVGSGCNELKGPLRPPQGRYTIRSEISLKPQL